MIVPPSAARFGLDPKRKGDRVADFLLNMNHRLERVCEVLKRELGVLIVRELTFPVPLVTVSGVDITPDLKQAHIHISAFGTNAEKRKVISILEDNRVTLQTGISKRLILKHTPHLHFRIDESIERGSRVLDILDNLGLDENK